MEFENRLLEKEASESDKSWENVLRPLSFKDFPGQTAVKEKLQVFIEAARQRKEPMDHTLMSGLDVTPTIALGNLDIVTAAAGLAELAVVPKCER